MTTSNLEYALKYAKAGWKLHPCKVDKTPYLNDWPNVATSDPEQLTRWWAQWPDASIGCATGEASGHWVLDADGEEGIKQAQEMNLPITLTSRTGGGGLQFFFISNGTEIRNSAKKVASHIDVRGNGGYVILPPSSHPSGNKYFWEKKTKIVAAPEWLVEKVKKQPEKTVTHLPGETTRYGQAALVNEMAILSSASHGARNDALNTSAYNLGTLIACGELDENQARNGLLATALTIGLPEKESIKTIESGFKAGKQHPRDRETNETKGTNGTFETRGDKWDSRGQSGTLWGQMGQRFPGNIQDEIEQYVKENQGFFTNADIDREFGLTDRQDKKNRSRALIHIEKKLLIKRDNRVASKWHILTSSAEWIDLESTSDEYFEIDLPLGLNGLVNLPPKCIVVVAGTSNAGKTAISLEIMRANLQKPYNRLYMMSEMGPSEYKQRVSKKTQSIKEWNERVKSAIVPAGFSATITQHNRDGLNVVDYLEEVDGEYYRIASDIRSIYDALNEGIAIVCIQKHPKARVGRGGEGTTEKARLYLTMDTLANSPQATIVAVKIIKAKDYPGANPNGKEIHVKIENKGASITAISEWMYCNEVQREHYARKYEQRISVGGDFAEREHTEDALEMVTNKGRTVRILGKDINRWQESYKSVDVAAEVGRIAVDSYKKPFLDDKAYFHQISGILRKKNQEAAQ